jgi:L-threonylcarbamoyladenylate synthase
MLKTKKINRCEYYKTSQNKPTKRALGKAAKILRSGGIIIYPTDTLYGFGVNISDKQAIDRLYAIKGRNTTKPFSILINTIRQAEELAGKFSPRERKLFDVLLPGKVTLLLKIRKKMYIPGFHHLDKLGIRIPKSKLCQQLIELTGSPISSSSVNISGRANLGDMFDIQRIFGEKVDCILDAGPILSSKGSSIIDITTIPPTLIREGEIPQEEIETTLGYKIKSNITRKFRITFICSGNICRSPMAEGILKKEISNTIYHENIEINSAGTLNIPSSLASTDSIKVSAQNNIDINNHLSTPVNRLILDKANLVFCLAEQHYDYLIRHYPKYADKTHILKSWKNSNKLSDPSIDDPIGMSRQFYEQIFKEIEEEVKRILPHILKEVVRHLYRLSTSMK